MSTRREQLSDKVDLISLDMKGIAQDLSDDENIDLWSVLIELHEGIKRIQEVIAEINTISVEALNQVLRSKEK